MMKKIIATSLALALLVAIVPAALGDSGDLKPYSGWIGADSPLYKIKLYFQKLDVSFTAGNTEKLNKQMAYADERLSEAQAMALTNNAVACDMALDEYMETLDELNNTTEAPDINETDYSNLSPMLIHHQQVFYALMNNSTVPMTIKDGLMCANNRTIKIKNGMPFYYYNGTAYFMPPGQMKNINSTHVPPGLAKKGYVKPVPTITNGSTVWPWDEIDYAYNTTLPSLKQNNGKGNGNGNGKGNKH